MPIDAVSSISSPANWIGAFSDRRIESAKAEGVGDHRDGAEPRQAVAIPQQPGKTACHRQQDGVADAETELRIDLAEVVDIDMEDRRPYRAVPARQTDHRVEPADQELPVLEPRQIVMDAVKQQALFGVLDIGDVDHGSDAANDLAITAE